MRRGKKFLEDLDRDIRDHIEHETRDNIERGMSPEEARHAAARKFGNIALVKEDTRAVWIPIWIEQFLQDTRYGVRMLRRNPGFTAVVILTLTLGIGMNTAIFSVFNAVLLRPLHYPDAERLLWLSTQGRGIPFGMEAVATADYVDWREQAISFENMVAYDIRDATLYVATTDTATRARIASVADDFWRLSGAHAALGRLPRPGEQDVMLLSHAFFEQQFQSDPHILGRAITVEGRQVTITGVLPNGFLFQLPPPTWLKFDSSKAIDAYRPMILSPQDRVRSGLATTFVVAKLKPGIPKEGARAELEAIRGRVAQANPNWFPNRATLRVIPLWEKLVGKARPALWVLLGAVVFVLLIACANIANLLLARSSTRQKEMAIRASVGAGRGRMLRQFLVESGMLAMLGGAGGLLVAHWGLTIVLRLIPDAVPRLAETTIDGRVLAYALGISILTACLFGVGPAISLWKSNLHTVLNDGVRTSSATSGNLRTRSLLVTVEFALAVVLLSGAGLMLKSFWRMGAHPPGLDPEHILVMKVQHSGPEYRDVLRQRAYADDVLRGLQSVPGVRAASITSPDALISPFVEGVSFAPGAPPPPAVFNVTSAACADVMGMRVLKGRWITDSEPTAVVVVNESLARNDFDGRDPIGMRIRLPGRSVATVVGVVADLKDSKLDANPEPQLYIPYAHAPNLGRITVVVRTAGDTLATAPAVRKVVYGIDKTQAVFDVMTMEQALSNSIAPRRFNLFLLGAFGLAALSLAMIGIYGVMAYSVTRRTHEIGVRMALGAQRGEVVSMVVRQGLGISLAGIVIGMIAASGLTRLMESLLYDVKPTDPQTFTAVAFVLSITALAACWVPAFKAALVDPVIALRYE